MNKNVKNKLPFLQKNYEEVTGKTFNYFFCPLLLTDEDVEIIMAHIINKSFENSPRTWTIQRKDIDNFYGRIFESEFLKLEIKYSDINMQDLLFDKKLNNKYSPKLFINNEQVEYFISDKKQIPNCEKIIFDDGQTLFIKKQGLKSNTKAYTEIYFDLRLFALVSLIKAAYLTAFEIFGYNYALSSGGLIIGHHLLGEFFLNNKKNSKEKIIDNAKLFFNNYINLMRPVEKNFLGLKGTSIDSQFLICSHNNIFWGVVVFINTSKNFHAVLLPSYDSKEGEVIFNNFLKSKDGEFYFRIAKFENNVWTISPKDIPLNWGFKNCNLS